MYKIILFLLYLFATLSFPMVGILSHEYFCQYNKKTSGLIFYYQSHIYNMFIGSIQTVTHTKFSCECSYCQMQSLFCPQLGWVLFNIYISRVGKPSPNLSWQSNFCLTTFPPTTTSCRNSQICKLYLQIWQWHK